MTPDEPSLSDHEQRILAEIERNLKAEDPDFVRQVSEARPTKDATRLLRLSIFGLILGIALLIGYVVRFQLGIIGFIVMVLAVVGIVTSVRSLASGGNSPGSLFRDMFRRAEERMRTRRPPEK